MVRFAPASAYSSLLWLVLLLAGCQYEPDGEFFKEVDANKVAAPSIGLEDAYSTISLNEKTWFNYNVATSRKHLQTEVFFDGEQLSYNDYRSDGSFRLDPLDYEEGEYTLTIRTVTGSGTGSLADKLDAEYIQSERTWNVIIERPKPVDVKRVFIDSGSIRLEWEAYKPLKLEKFLYYEVSYDEHYGGVVARVENPDITSAYDKSFLFGSRNYQVVVVTEHHTARGNSFEYTLLSDIVLEVHELDDTLKVQWNQSVLHNNIDEYEVSTCCNATSYSRKNVITVDNRLNQVSFYGPDNVKFGGKSEVELRVINSHNQNHAASKDLSVGKKIEFDQELLYSPYAATYYNAFYRSGSGYNGSSGSLDGKFDANFVQKNTSASHYSRYLTHSPPKYIISPDGKIMYSIGFKVAQLDPYTLKEIRSYDTKEITKRSGYSSLGKISVSNDYTLVISGSRPMAIDMRDTTQLLRFDSFARLTLSPDGQFLLAADTLFQRSGQDYVSIAVLDKVQSAQVGFSSLHPHQLIIAEKHFIRTYDCQTLSFSDDFSLPESPENSYYFSIDPFSGLIGAYSQRGEYYYVVDLEKKSVEKIAISSHYNYFLLNGYLFSSEGFYLNFAE